jgi:membrane-associated protease RseP (regulator of RpoE activity)
MSGSGSSYGAFPPPPTSPPAALPGPPEPPPTADSLNTGDAEDADGQPEPGWRLPALLFALSVVSVFFVGSALNAPPESTLLQVITRIHTGYNYAVPLLSILLAHEFGHYIAARVHGVPASLPHFLPFPVGAGTLGAVIAMRGPIRSRNALLDIGASGPLAGLVVAIPTLIVGIMLSKVEPLPPTDYDVEGQSLIYWLLKRIVLGPIPPSHDIIMSPTAFAGWIGLLITMLNLLPWGQLDGGHIAYALFGKHQDRAAVWVKRALIPLALGNLLWLTIPIAVGSSSMTYGKALLSSVSWLVWWVFLDALSRRSGGDEHPPCEPGPLSPVRKVVAVLSLVLFVLLFMPRPMTSY